MAALPIDPSNLKRKSRQPQGGCWRHGLSDTRLETIFEKMKARCYNPRDKRFSRYGGRGIEICPEWLGSAAAFYEWALANGYRDDLQIHRIDNDKGYGPDNCEWVSALEQQNNRTNNTRLIFEGENLTLAEWSRKTGIRRNTLSARHHSRWHVAAVLGFASMLPRGHAVLKRIAFEDAA
jgi:hypothetical protein